MHPVKMTELNRIVKPGNAGKPMQQNQLNNSQQCLERIVKRTAHLSLSTDIDVDHATEVFVAATRLAGMFGSGRPETQSALAEFRRMVAAILDIGEGGQHGSFVTDCVRDTNVVASTIQDWQTSGHRRNYPHRQDSKVEYCVVEGDEIAYLVERRASGDSMRVPESDYMAAIKTFSGESITERRFDALIASFESYGGQAVASHYPLRIVLRFWRSLDPPLIVRQNALYRMTVNAFAEFEGQAMAAWNDASDRQLTTQSA